MMSTGLESDEQQKIRFQIELEFVQCLANPSYLNYLAQNGHLKNKCFINYIKYLQYWKRPEYCKFLRYPMALHFLDLLQYEHFRVEMANSQCAKFIEDQQLLHWQHYIRKRTRLITSGGGSLPAGNQGVPGSSGPSGPSSAGPTQDK